MPSDERRAGLASSFVQSPAPFLRRMAGDDIGDEADGGKRRQVQLHHRYI